MSNITRLEWNNDCIPHKLWVDEFKGKTILTLKVIKDIEPQTLELEMEYSIDEVLSAWKGEAASVSDAYDDGQVYSQVRTLMNLKDGCVIWCVNHILMPCGNKTSIDTIGYIPSMHESKNLLTKISC